MLNEQLADQLLRRTSSSGAVGGGVTSDTPTPAAAYPLLDDEDAIIHNHLLEARNAAMIQSQTRIEDENSFLKHQLKLRDKKMDSTAAKMGRMEATIAQLQRMVNEKDKLLSQHKSSKFDLLNKIDNLTEENLKLLSEAESLRRRCLDAERQGFIYVTPSTTTNNHTTPTPTDAHLHRTASMTLSNSLVRRTTSIGANNNFNTAAGVMGVTASSRRTSFTSINGVSPAAASASASILATTTAEQYQHLMDHKVQCVILRRKLREARHKMADVFALREQSAMELADQRSFVDDLLEKQGGHGVVNIKLLARRMRSAAMAGNPNVVDDVTAGMTEAEEAAMEAYSKTANKPKVFGADATAANYLHYSATNAKLSMGAFPTLPMELKTLAEAEFVANKYRQSAFGDVLKELEADLTTVATRAKEAHDKHQNSLLHVFTDATRRGGSLLANPKQDYLTHLTNNLRDYNMAMNNVMRTYREYVVRIVNAEKALKERLEGEIRAALQSNTTSVSTQVDLESPEMIAMAEKLSFVERNHMDAVKKHHKQVQQLEDAKTKAQINEQYLQSKIFEWHESVYDTLSAVQRHRFQWISSVPNVFADLLKGSGNNKDKESDGNSGNGSPTEPASPTTPTTTIHYNLRIGNAIDEERKLLGKFAHYFLSSDLFGTINSATMNAKAMGVGGGTTASAGSAITASSSHFLGGTTSSSASANNTISDGLREYQRTTKARARMTDQRQAAKHSLDAAQRLLKQEEKEMKQQQQLAAAVNKKATAVDDDDDQQRRASTALVGVGRKSSVGPTSRTSSAHGGNATTTSGSRIIGRVGSSTTLSQGPPTPRGNNKPPMANGAASTTTSGIRQRMGSLINSSILMGADNNNAVIGGDEEEEDFLAEIGAVAVTSNVGSHAATPAVVSLSSAAANNRITFLEEADDHNDVGAPTGEVFLGGRRVPTSTTTFPYDTSSAEPPQGPCTPLQLSMMMAEGGNSTAPMTKCIPSAPTSKRTSPTRQQQVAAAPNNGNAVSSASTSYAHTPTQPSTPISKPHFNTIAPRRRASTFGGTSAMNHRRPGLAASEDTDQQQQATPTTGEFSFPLPPHADDAAVTNTTPSGNSTPRASGGSNTTTTQHPFARMAQWQKQQQEQWERKRQASIANSTTPTIVYVTQSTVANGSASTCSASAFGSVTASLSSNKENIVDVSKWGNGGGLGGVVNKNTNSSSAAAGSGLPHIGGMSFAGISATSSSSSGQPLGLRRHNSYNNK